ncbi:hypothetical protein EAF00_001239 [Botryotinia globosa]|nr:hypothetical protein EAF00_001239 [Botryotinia globosa]
MTTSGCLLFIIASKTKRSRLEGLQNEARRLLYGKRHPAGSQRKEDKRLSKDPSQAFQEYPKPTEATQPQSFVTRIPSSRSRTRRIWKYSESSQAEKTDFLMW